MPWRFKIFEYSSIQFFTIQYSNIQNQILNIQIFAACLQAPTYCPYTSKYSNIPQFKFWNIQYSHIQQLDIQCSNICSLPTSAHLLPWHFNVKYVELLHRTISTLGVMSFFAFLVVVLFFIFFFGLFNHVHWINWLYWKWFSSRWHFCVISGHCCYSCRAFFRRSTKRKAVKGSLRFTTMMA